MKPSQDFRFPIGSTCTCLTVLRMRDNAITATLTGDTETARPLLRRRRRGFAGRRPRLQDATEWARDGCLSL